MKTLDRFHAELPGKHNELPTLAARICLPEDSRIGWQTVLTFEDGIHGFATVDRKFVDLQSGRSVEDCYAAIGKKLTLLDRLANPNIVLYVYRTTLEGCTIGVSFPVTDVTDGERRMLRSFWRYSLKVADPSLLLEPIAQQANGILSSFECSRMLADKYHLTSLLTDALQAVLKDTPCDALQCHTNKVIKEVEQRYIDKGIQDKCGLSLTGFSLGNISFD